MPDLRHFPEPFHQHGGTLAEVMVDATAAAQLERTTVLLREVLQNSCDARHEEGTPIKFLVHAYALSEEQAAFVRKEFKAVSSLRIGETLARGEITALLFADTNTVGLRGPVDAGEASEHSNFSNFFFQIGRSAADGEGAGSFGLGRTVMFAFSRCRTALVYSRFQHGRSTRSRLMGMSIGSGFIQGGRKFTGRHWWSDPNAETGYSTPIEGVEADRIARLLGMDEAFTRASDTGTSILILQPYDLTGDEDDAEDVDRAMDSGSRRKMIETMRRAAELYAWPHMIEPDSVSFEFKSDDQTIPLRKIDDDPVLRNYAKAYRALSASEDSPRRSKIEFLGNVPEGSGRVLGEVSYVVSAETADDAAAMHEGVPLNSVALMRQARFIVKYLKVDGVDGYAMRGVFLSHPDFESVYRKSEPVTHDDWLPAKLGYAPKKKNEIKQTYTKISDALAKELGKSASSAIAAGSMPVGLANVMGRILSGVGVHGSRGGESEKSRGSSPVGGGGGKRRFSLVELDPVRVIKSNSSGSLIDFDFRVDGALGDEKELPRLQFLVSAFTADGERERPGEGPEYSRLPNIHIVKIDGIDRGTGAIDLLPGDLGKVITVRVICPAGFAAACSGRLLGEAR